MTERDRQISEIVAGERSRLRNFIRMRVPDPSDVEDIVQEVFYEPVEANRLLMPIDHVTGRLFRVARNRTTDLFRKKKPEAFSDRTVEGGGFGLSGGGARSNSRKRMRDRWEQMTAEERETFRQGLHDRGGRTTPLDSNPSI